MPTLVDREDWDERSASQEEFGGWDEDWDEENDWQFDYDWLDDWEAVSYTHLTLPTKA